MKEKKLIIFIPSVEGGGVEKNFFLVSNYLSQRFRNVSVITADKNIKSKLSKKIILICPKSNSWSKKKRLERENTYCNNNSDIDNYIKAILDSLNGVYFIDDRQVVEVFASKKYSNEPRILFTMMEMDNDKRGDV